MKPHLPKPLENQHIDEMFLSLEPRQHLTASSAAIDLRAIDARASEGGSLGAAVVELVRLGGDISTAVPVRLGTSGEARLGARGDYEFYVNGSRINGSVIELPAGAVRVEVELRAIDDGVAEAEETAMLTILPGRGYFKSRFHTPVQISIADNEPVLSLSVPDASASETGDRARWVLSRSGDLQRPLTVLTQFTGSAKLTGNAADFEVLLSAGSLSHQSGQLTFPAGIASITLTAVPINDAVVEGIETSELVIRTATTYRVQGAASARVSISDDEPSLRIEGGGQSLTEGGGSIFLTVIRTGSLNSELPVTLRFGGAATNAGPRPDVLIRVLEFPYLGRTGSFIMPVGLDRAIVEISVVDDGDAEQLEQLEVSIQPGRDYWLSSSAPTVARVSVLDNEPAIAVVAPSGSPVEGQTGGSFIIQRTGIADRQISVGLNWSGTARFGISGDYTIAAIGGELSEDGRTLIMPPGVTEVELVVTALTDFVNEGAESIQLTILPRTQYAVPDENAGRTATLDIVDSGTFITFGPRDLRIEEAAGTGRFVLTRTGQTDIALTIPLIWGGTAARSGPNADLRLSISGASLDASQRMLTFAPGQTRAEILVEAIEDRLVEPDETITLSIRSTREYGVSKLPGSRPATITVVDNEPTYSITSPERMAGESFTNQNLFTGRFVITRTSSEQPQSLRLKLSGTAQYAPGLVDGGDYFLRLNGQDIAGSNVIIPAGESQLILEVVPIDDNLAESFEQVKIELMPSTEYRIDAARKSGSTTIADNEPRFEMVVVQPRSQINEVTRLEANERQSVLLTRRLPQEGFLFTSTNPANLIVNMSVGGSASPNLDYRLEWSLGSQRFALGEARLFSVDLRDQGQVILDFTAKNDRIVEEVEQIFLSLDLTQAQRNDGDYSTMYVTKVVCNEPLVSVKWDTFPSGTFGEDSIIRRRGFIFRSEPRNNSSNVDRVFVTFALSGEAQQGSDYVTRQELDLDGSGRLITSTSILIESSISSNEARLGLEAIDDAEAEPDEELVINLLGPSGESPSDYVVDRSLDRTVFARSTANGVIRDNDLLEITSITSSGTVSESAGQPARFTIERSDRDLSREALVPVTISGASSRFTLSSLGAAVPVGQSFIRIPAGQRTVTVDVVPVDDSEVNGTANVSLSVRTQPGVRLASGVPSSARVSITDDDRRPPTNLALWNVGITGDDIPKFDFIGDLGYFDVTVTSQTLPGTATDLSLRISGTAVEGVHVSVIPRQINFSRRILPNSGGLSLSEVTFRVRRLSFEVNRNLSLTIEIVPRNGMNILPGFGSHTLTRI